MYNYRANMGFDQWLRNARLEATGINLNQYYAEQREWTIYFGERLGEGVARSVAIAQTNVWMAGRQMDWEREQQPPNLNDAWRPMALRGLRERRIDDPDFFERPEDDMPIQKKTKVAGKPFFENILEEAFPGFLRGFGPKCDEVGVEIECEGEDLFREPISFWKAVADQSLRAVGNSQPIEYVLKKPLPRDKVKKALEYLASGLKQSGAKLVWSGRTSVHVHVNCRDITMMQIINFICIYWILEGVLTEWAGPDRKGNLFCLRAQDAEYQVAALVKACQTLNFGHSFSTEYRYAGCNISSLSNHGSLEFRTMKGTADVQRITDWVYILTALKDRAQEFKNPAEIGNLFLSKGPIAFLKSVFDDKNIRSATHDWLFQTPLLADLLNNAFHAAKDAMFAIDWTEPVKTDRGRITMRNSLRGRNDDEDEDY